MRLLIQRVKNASVSVGGDELSRIGQGLLVLVGLGGMTSAPTQAWWRQAMLAAPLETAVLATKPWLPDDVAKRTRFK